MLASVTANKTTVFTSAQGFHTVRFMNKGPGVCYYEVTASDAVTPNATNSPYFLANETIYLDVHQASVFMVSNSTASVVYT